MHNTCALIRCFYVIDLIVVFSFASDKMSFETKEGTECVVRNYRELQVIYSNPLLILIIRFVFA